MRTVVPKLVLTGVSKHQGIKYIPWAKKQLAKLKQLPGLGIIDNSYRPSPNVNVRIYSVNGIDTIFIKTFGGKYSCEFPQVVSCSPSNCSDFQLRCWTPHNAVGFLMRTPTGYWDNYHWDFGDGNTFDGGDFTGGWSLNHEYDEPGYYTVSVTATKDVIETTDGGVNNGADRKEGIDTDPGATPAAAYADYLADTPSVVGNDYEWTSRSTQKWDGTKTYQFESQENDFTFDLSGIAANATVTLIMRLLRLDTVVHWPNFGDPSTVVANGEPGVTSSLGVTKTPIIGGEFAPWEEFEMGDMTPFIGDSAKNITMVDSTGNVQLPTYLPGTPGFPSTFQNRVGCLGLSPWIKIETPTDIKTTTKEIRVNTGRPKKTRQIGESIHT